MIGCQVSWSCGLEIFIMLLITFLIGIWWGYKEGFINSCQDKGVKD
jgi:hypothetical protein